MTADERTALVLTKVERAKKHIEELELAIRTFIDSGAYEIRAEEDANIGKRSYYLSRADPVPATIAAIVGDVLQNLRSALDHAAYQLVTVGVGCPPLKPWEIEFPIADKPSEYPRLRDRKVKGARQDALDAIDAAKPYKGGNDTLWRLHKLNNVDKHRLLLTVGSSFRSINISPLMGEVISRAAPWARNFIIPELFLRPALDMFPLKVGDALFIDSIEHKFHEKMDFRLEISFGEPQILECEPIIETVQHMADLVSSIIMSFKPCFA